MASPIYAQRSHCWRDRYNSTISGPSGNITVNGTLTYGAETNGTTLFTKRGLGAGGQEDVDLNVPPYAIHNGQSRPFRKEGVLDSLLRQWSSISARPSDQRHTCWWLRRVGHA